ncbi:MAG: hypothetical protein KF819_31975 [Labilithrix sp.]|nr:hypothetical protein [Labilithrix sp.]
MGQTPSRKSTQPGLGQVKGEPRRTTVRPRDEAPASGPPQGVTAISSDTPPPQSGLADRKHTPPTQTKWFTPPPEGSFRNPSPEPPPWTRHPTAKVPPTRDERDLRDERDEDEKREERDARAKREERAKRSTAPAPKRTASATPAAKRASSAPPRRSVPPKRASVAPKAASGPPKRIKKERVSIRVDDVGDGGVAIVADGSGLGPNMVPRVLRSKQELAAAPMDHREGFVLALIDGNTTVQGVVDVSGMDDGEVTTILQRLRRLGIIAIR